MRLLDPILFFDADCGFCVWCMNWLRRRDREKRLQFVPINSDLARQLLRETYPTFRDANSLLFVGAEVDARQTPVLFRSDAVIAALVAVGGVWKAATCLRIVPRFIRDGAYNIVAKVRHRLAPGTSKDCCKQPLDVPAGRVD